LITNDNFWIWFGSIWLAVGLMFLVIGGGIGWSRSTLDARLDQEGMSVEGVVLAKEIVTSDDRSERYRATFRFSDAHGVAVRGTADLSADAWDALVERGPIGVVFLPDRSSTYRVAGESRADAVLALVFPLVGAVLAAVGGLIVGNALRARGTRRRLLGSGAIAAGTVIDIGPGNLRINGIPQWELRYSFRDAHGRTHEGKRVLAHDEAREWQPGAVGRVRYDSRNPRTQVWTGDPW
jgi:hypothetical protein